MVVPAIIGFLAVGAGIVMIVYAREVAAYVTSQRSRMLFVRDDFPRKTYPTITFRLLGCLAVLIGCVFLFVGLIKPLFA